MDLGIIKEFLTNTGPTAALAALAIILLDRSWRARLDESKQYGERLESLYRQALHAIGTHTESMAKLTARIETFIQQMGKRDGSA